MRSLKMALIALMLTMLFGTPAKARDHAVNGLIIGTTDMKTVTGGKSSSPISR